MQTGTEAKPQQLRRTLKAIKVSQGYTCTQLGKTAASWTAKDAEPLAVVFVHGFKGDYISTWQSSAPLWRRLFQREKKTLFEYLQEDPAYRCQYFTFGHPAGRFLSRAKLGNIAGALRTFIKTQVLQHANAVLLVAHSIGGLISRRAILDYLKEAGADELPVHGLLMYGTPNDGTNIARIPLPIRVLPEIVHDSAFIEELNRDWIGRVINGGNPAYPIEQRTDLLCRYVVGIDDWVVGTASAEHLGYLGEILQTNLTHTTLTKPTNQYHDGLVLLKQFIDVGRQRVAARRLLRGAVRAATRTLATLKAAEWFEREDVTIELRHTPTKGILSIHEITHRRGVMCYPTFTCAVRLVGITPPTDRRIDYRHTIGPGLLTTEEYQRATDGVDSAALAQRVKLRVVVVIDGVQQQYVEENPETNTAGYALILLRCDKVPPDGIRADDLWITLDTQMQEKIGWYSYRTRRAITDSLHIRWSAPFRVTSRPYLQTSAEPTVTPNTNAGNGIFESTVSADTLISPNASVDFIFERT